MLRIGAGVFSDRRPPTVLERALRYNGVQTQQYVLPNPTYPFVDPSQLSLVPTSVWQIDPILTFPKIYQASVTLEQQLPGGFVLVSDYTYQRGNHLFRARDINAPLPDTGLRPVQDRGDVDQLESSASSRAEIFNATLKSTPKRRFQFFAQYTESWLDDDTGGAFAPPPGASQAGIFTALLPADSYDLRSEWGRANNDARHRFGFSGTVQLPWQFNFGTLTSIRSGLPYNITTGQDSAEGVANLCPPGVTRNSGNGPGQIIVDVHLGRTIRIHRDNPKADVDIGVDAFNVLNHSNFNNYISVVTSPFFGKANSAMDGRQMQFNLQARF